MLNSCGGTYGHLVMKHMSQSVHLSVMSSKSFLVRSSTDSFGESSIKSNNVGKLSQRLKHLLQL